MANFGSRLLLTSALVAVPATALVAAPVAAQPATAVAAPAPAPAAKATKQVVLTQLRTGKSGDSVQRYQVHLRKYAKSKGINLRKINRSGATGYYGTETRKLTKTVTKNLAARNSSWIPRSRSKAAVHPNSKLVKVVGLKAIKAPVATSTVAAPAAAPATNTAWPAIIAVGPTTKHSKWQGPALKHPRTGKAFETNISRWANLVRGVMQEHGVADKYLVGILAQIQQESGGNPDVVNNWDSNAAKGTPSKGLLQVILPTYKYYAKAGYKTSKYQTVPYTNIWAALNYVKGRYGMSKFASWNSGYNQGY